jgi:hypothetical protein
VPAALLLAPAGPVHHAYAGGAGNVLAEFDVAKGGDLILLPVRLKGKTYHFAMDTGASVTAYDRSLKPLLGQPISTARGETNSKLIDVQLFAPPDAKIGDLPVRGPLPVTVLDLRALREASGLDVYGVIGMDFLQRYVIRIDFDRGKVAFLRAGQADAGRAVPMPFKRGTYWVEVQLGGVAGPQWFMVDTGDHNSLGLTKDLLGHLVRAGKASWGAQRLRADAAGEHQERDARLAPLTVGGFEHHRLTANAVTGNNVLGLGYLSRYVVTFDFPGGRLYLKKGGTFDQPEPCDRTGLTLRRIAGKATVYAVAKGSPAESAGIRPKDLLDEVEGKGLDRWSFHQLSRLFGDGQKKSINLRVRRGERVLRVTVQLEAGQPSAVVPAAN